MKKAILGLVVLATLASCDFSAKTEKVSTDSTAVKVDSLTVVVDSTKEVKTDTTNLAK